MARKQLSCLSIPRHCRVAHVDHGVLDIRVPSTVLHKGHIGSCIQQMHRDRVAQRMKAPFGLRNSSPLAVCLHQVPVGAPLQRQATIGDEERGGIVLTGPQVGPTGGKLRYDLISPSEACDDFRFTILHW